MPERSRNIKRTAPRRSEPRRLDSLETAYAAYYGGDYTGCLEHIGRLHATQRGASEARLLRIRALYRLGDAATMTLAAQGELRVTRDSSERLILVGLIAAALRVLKRDSEAQGLFEEGLRLAADASLEARAEFSYLRAVAAWEDGDVDSAERIVDESLAAATGIQAAMLVQLLGWIEIRRERSAAAAEHFLRSLELFQTTGQRDLRFTTRLIHVTAMIASETIDLRLAKRLAHFLEDARWPPTMAREHFNTLKCLRFLALLQGDVKRAWFLSRDGVDIAPNLPFRAIAATNAAAVSLLVGDKFAADVQFNEAWSTIESVSWSEADEEERVALTNFAIEAAHVLPHLARSAITIYRNVTGNLDRRIAFHGGDRRLQAFEAMAAGRVSEAIGNVADAIANYEISRDIWVSLDYRMRAALVATDLRRLTQSDRWNADISVALVRAPRAWFGGDPPSISADTEAALPIAALTAGERLVLQHLLGGDSVPQIAKRMGRSPFTVHNHSRRIFSAFEVKSRMALVRRCAELGIRTEDL